MEMTKTTRTAFMLSLVFLLFSLMDVCPSEADILKKIHLKDGSVIQCDVCWLDLGWLMNENAPVLYEQGEDLKMIAISLVDLEKTFGKDIALKYKKAWAEKRRSQELLKRAKELREQGGSNVSGTFFDFDGWSVEDFRVKRNQGGDQNSSAVTYYITFDLRNSSRENKYSHFAIGTGLSVRIKACTASGVVLRTRQYTRDVKVGETVFCSTSMFLRRKEEVPQLGYWDVERVYPW
jgi:hypothetical protein